MRADVSHQVPTVDPAKVVDLVRIRTELARRFADEYVVQLLLAQSGTTIRRTVTKGKDWPEFSTESEFFAEPASGGLYEFFAGSRMSTAGVRPEPTEMVFCRRAFLEQHAPVRTEEYDGKSTMEEACARVGLELPGHADLSI
jgi:hypothetical protein